tara:strand:- start:391 stop:969 length:579 start_codon:yes stop_codon:yes gene_type:complete
MKVYIEAGANDGVFQSRSLELSKDSDYFGILVEPDPDEYAKCVKSRSTNTRIYNNCLVSSNYKESSITFYRHKNQSCVNGFLKSPVEPCTSQMLIPTRTLQSILDENSITHVDKLFLDVEGYEYEVMNGIDFTKTTFNYIEIECHYIKLKIDKDIEKQKHVKFMEQHSYQLINDRFIDGGNPKLIFAPIATR